MVAVASAKGYARTSVADLVELAGVSRATFYSMFADKRECFLATLDELLAGMLAAIDRRMRAEGPWEERARAALAGFAEAIVAQPAAARLCLMESHAAGEAAVARVDAALAGFRALLADPLEGRPAAERVPAPIADAMAGAARKLIVTRLHEGRQEELVELLPQLLELTLSYEPPPEPLRRSRARRDPPAAARSEPPREPLQRILVAALATIAEQGYGSTAISDITTRANVAPSTFYEHFDGKLEALLAALYDCQLRMLAATLPAYRRARSWPEGMRAALQAGLAFLAAEPDFARLISVDVYAAGPRALERRAQALQRAKRFLADAPGPGPVPIAAEAILSALYSLIAEHVRRRGAESLDELTPLATYMALAPFTGAEEACAVAASRSVQASDRFSMCDTAATKSAAPST